MVMLSVLLMIWQLAARTGMPVVSLLSWLLRLSISL